MLDGEHNVTLDEKGRLFIPAKVRAAFGEERTFTVTRGVDQFRCLWLFGPSEWKIISEQIRANTSLFNAKTRVLERRLLAPATTCELDRSNRIIIPQSLRDAAGLTRDVKLLVCISRIEVWDREEYERYLEASDEELVEAAEDLGDRIHFPEGKLKKEESNLK
ncbi:MAG: division/cell wall cluster transcriptional repressor MraZ [Spirochaetales bacterium]|jgi:MraZ protein|nr:division/cell wall cluster transcriptional repressor MraZ [Spirochaetales bacterium]